MNTSVVVAIITGLGTLIAPVLVKLLERNRREEIDQELKILKQLNPESKTYKLLNEHVEDSILDFSENDWLRSQYRNAYRRYIVFFLLLAFLYLMNIWTASAEDSSWYVVYQIVIGILYCLAAALGGSFLAPLVAALFSEYKRIKIEWEIKNKKFHADQLEIIVDQMEGSREEMERAREEMEREIQDIKRTHAIPENKEQEYANWYNQALWWGLRGTTREQAVEVLADVPILHEADTRQAANDAFDYFEEWSKKNEPLKFIEIPRDAS